MTPVTVPPDTLHAVHAVLIAAWEKLGAAGWRRNRPERGAAGGMRLIDALNYGSAAAAGDHTAHILAFACAAMAIELHTGAPAHALLPSALADHYLSDETSDDELHRLDASVILRYNTHVCAGWDDARALLHLAHEHAADTIAAQLAHHVTGRHAAAAR